MTPRTNPRQRRLRPRPSPRKTMQPYLLLMWPSLPKEPTKTRKGNQGKRSLARRLPPLLLKGSKKRPLRKGLKKKPPRRSPPTRKQLRRTLPLRKL